MKRTILILLMVLGPIANAQDKRCTLSLRTEMADKKTHNNTFYYGFNISIKYSYQRTVCYNDIEIYHFPKLNGFDYTHIEATLLGFNQHTKFENWRFNLGLIKAGLILRENGTYPMIGHEIGIEHYFDNNTFIGLKIGVDYKADSKLWNEPTHTVFFVTLEIGIEW